MQKFLDAQQHDFDSALAEIRNGRKQGHWMWYIFPQLKGLGRSSISIRYAIENLDEAARYLDHPILGPRLIQISEAILAVEGKSAYQIMGSPDDLKLRSCMTLFNLAPGTNPVFQSVLDKYFSGKPDPLTMELIAPASSGNHPGQ
ncbi:MAG: calpastatin [Dyadobacter sp. 50-39]|uniref:DUF1810 domain-containing protein n=1 Tax=Dyadobacter sp. 50-39 TaxID=1895756 RepID=UPI00095B8487|nr:DUF1810 domain-containing protein [Dyadobacter sp. 50-39]OJV20577.1 MAG: calpastatin [Dyadobacter sp. 50-39]